MIHSLDLLTNASDTGSWLMFDGGRSVATFMGTVGGATITLELLGKDGSTAVPVKALPAAGVYRVDVPMGMYRVSVSGGSPSGLYVTLQNLPGC